MGKRNTFEGYLRAHGGRPRSVVSPGVLTAMLIVRGLDATVDAGTVTGLFLPAGAIVTKVTAEESTAASGGTAPKLDIGINFIGSTTDDPDGLVANVAFDASSITRLTDALAGVLLGQPLAGAGEVTYGDDGVGTNNTAGAFDLYIEYTFEDDGVVND